MADDGPHSNPFRVPNDRDAVRVLRQEQEEHEKARRHNLSLHVHEKSTASSRIGRMAQRSQFEEDDNEAGSPHSSKKSTVLAKSGKSAIFDSKRRPNDDTQNMTEFLSKKREIFFVQMSLDTKREEIQKLKSLSHTKEADLLQKEQKIEEEAMKFDVFLKENDKKAREAVKVAEAEAKLKKEKLQELKKLHNSVQMTQSEICKLKEQLEDCMNYRAFLDSLTPQEYSDRCKEDRSKRSGMKFKTGRPGNVEADVIEGSHNDDRLQSRQRDCGGRNEEDDMYFREPSQLLSIFTALEESNLFLIQNNQEAEQSLEELFQKYEKKKEEADSKIGGLKKTMDRLTQQKNKEESRLVGSAGSLSEKDGGEPGSRRLNILHEKVKEVYRNCGGEADTNPTTAFMLTDLEIKLESLLKQTMQMPIEYVVKAEKMREKERRERVRQERVLEQQRIYEERMLKSMERSMQAPKKPKGKKIMFRSKPLKKVKKVETNDTNTEESSSDLKYLT